MVYSPIVNAFRQTPQEAGGQPDYMQALRQGMLGAREAVDTVYKPKNMAEALLQAQLKNKHDTIINQFLPRSEEARIGGAEANRAAREILNQYLPESERARINNIESETGLRGQQTYREKLLNQYLPESERARIDEMKARGEYYQAGGGGRGVGSKSESEFLNNVRLDNPDLDPSQYREAANAIRNGQNTLSDGTRINVTPTTLSALDRVIKAGTTANLINAGVKASQGEEELKALDNYFTTLENPYQTTILGVSPQQIKDSSDPSEAAQKRLGQSIAIQALNYEKAQLRNNIAGGTPGITAINELMSHSGQIIKNYAPQISGVARQEAERVINEGIDKMRKARQSVGFSPSSLRQNKSESNKKVIKYVLKNGRYVPSQG